MKRHIQDNQPKITRGATKTFKKTHHMFMKMQRSTCSWDGEKLCQVHKGWSTWYNLRKVKLYLHPRPYLSNAYISFAGALSRNVTHILLKKTLDVIKRYITLTQIFFWCFLYQLLFFFLFLSKHLFVNISNLD